MCTIQQIKLQNRSANIGLLDLTHSNDQKSKDISFGLKSEKNRKSSNYIHGRGNRKLIMINCFSAMQYHFSQK